MYVCIYEWHFFLWTFFCWPMVILLLYGIPLKLSHCIKTFVKDETQLLFPLLSALDNQCEAVFLIHGLFRSLVLMKIYNMYPFTVVYFISIMSSLCLKCYKVNHKGIYTSLTGTWCILHIGVVWTALVFLQIYRFNCHYDSLHLYL